MPPPEVEVSTEPIPPETHEATVSSDSGDSAKQTTRSGYDPAVSDNSKVSANPVPSEGHDATVSSNDVTESAVTEDPEVFPPSESPQPPGISDTDHPSGYLMEKKSEEIHTTVESQLTVSMTTESVTAPSGSSSAEHYESNTLGVSDSDLDLQNIGTTPVSTHVSEAESTDHYGVNLPDQGVSAEPLPGNGCPVPEVCGKNCGIYVDSNGCQSCQCLWLPIRKIFL